MLLKVGKEIQLPKNNSKMEMIPNMKNGYKIPITKGNSIRK